MLTYIHLIKTKKHGFLLFSHGKDSIPVANPSLAQASTQDPKQTTNISWMQNKDDMDEWVMLADTVSINESDSEHNNEPHDNFQQANSQIDHNETVISNENQSNLTETIKSNENQIVENSEVVKPSAQKNTKTPPSNNTIKLNLPTHKTTGSKSNSNNKIYYIIIIFGCICLSLVYFMLYDNKKSKSTDH